MAETKSKYAASTALTLGLTSLAIDGYRQSTAIDNTTNLYLDALVGGSTQVGVVTVDGALEIYAYGTWDNGTNYSGGLDGVDATITWGTTPSTSSVEGFRQLVLLGVVSVDATDDDNDIEWGPFSVAAGFGSILPLKWGIVVKNATDIALHATGTNNSVEYTGITLTTA